MALGKPEQPDRIPRDETERERFRRQKRSRWFHKQRKQQTRKERRKAKSDPEVVPEYGKSLGWY